MACSSTAGAGEDRSKLCTSLPDRTHGRYCVCGFEVAHHEDPLLSALSVMSTMASLAVITMVLIVVGISRWLRSEVQRISMAHVEFEITK
jgi:hypothetical protein